MSSGKVTVILSASGLVVGLPVRDDKAGGGVMESGGEHGGDVMERLQWVEKP